MHMMLRNLFVLVFLTVILAFVYISPGFWSKAIHVPSADLQTNHGDIGFRAIETIGNSEQQPIGMDRSLVLSVQRPIGFEPNRGQTNHRFKFLSRGDGYRLFLGDREAVLSLDSEGGAATVRPRSVVAHESRPSGAHSERKIIGIRLLGARRNLTIEAEDQLPGRINYLVGNDPRHWHTDIPAYGRVVERGVWPGVDLAYYGNQRRIECDFIVAPRTNPDAIELELSMLANLGSTAMATLCSVTGGNS
jgi:hypothetical protein